MQDGRSNQSFQVKCSYCHQETWTKPCVYSNAIHSVCNIECRCSLLKTICYIPGGAVDSDYQQKVHLLCFDNFEPEIQSRI